MKNQTRRRFTPAIALALILTSLAVPGATAAATISAVSPSTGSSIGGDVVTITGTGFNSPTVTFGDVPAWIQSSTSTTIAAVAPPHAAGAVDVSVKNGAASPVSKTGAFTYEAAPTPTLTARAPTSGSANGGTEVTLTGTGFVPGAIVHFGSALAASVVYTSPQQIKAIAPPSAAGSFDIEVTNPDGSTTAGQSFTYTADDGPEITAVSHPAAPASGGMHLVITGTGFSDPEATIGGAAARVLEATATAITVQAPAHNPGDAPIVVLNPSGASDTASFEYFEDMQILSVDPMEASSRGGEEITIAGIGLPSGGAAKAFFGGVPAPECTAASSTAITCIAPPQAPGDKDIVVTNLDNGLSARITGAFAYEQAPAPTMAAVVANTGDSNGGFEALIGGTGFSAVPDHPPTVWLGEVQVPQEDVVVADGDSVYIQVPARSGTQEATEVRAVVVNPDGTSTPDLPCTSGGSVDPGCFRYEVAPAPTGPFVLDPDTGTSNGGQTVQVSGQGIHPGAAVAFGGVPAQFVSHDQDGIQVIVPPIDHDDVGLVDVTVTNPDGQTATTADAFTYTASPAPTHASGPLSAPAGPATGGTVVTIDGTGFATEAHKPTVRVGATIVPDHAVTVISATELSFTTPGGPQGAVDITVENPDGQSFTMADAFLYNAVDGPVLATASPAMAPASGGIPIVLTGTGFSAGSATPPRIALDGTLVATATVTSSTAMEFVLPPGAPGTVELKVLAQDGQESDPLDIRYLPEVGRLTAIEPEATADENGGLGVDLVGTGLPVSGASLRVGDAPMPMDGNPSSTLIEARIPAMPITEDEAEAGLVVGDSFGQTSTLWPFTYTAAPDPTCGSASPKTSGVNPGTQVSLAGTGFADGATIEIEDEVYGPRTVPAGTISATSISFAAPSGSFGPVDIKVTNPNGATCTLADAFGYLPQVNPTITAIAPEAGTLAGGEEVTLTGSNFKAGATVKFGTVTATVESLSGTSITATAPPSEEAEAVDIHVTNPGGMTATLEDAYTYSALPAPTITTVVPATGPSLGGSTIVVSGTGFQEGATLSIGGATAQDVDVSDTGTTLTATTPAHAADTVDVVLVNPDAQAASKTDAFTYTASAAPTITNVAPAAGPSTGGTSVTITGADFATGATVRIGTQAATGITVNAAGTHITATIPSGSGVQTVLVRNPDTQEATVEDGFAYWVSDLLDVAAANVGLMKTVIVTRSNADNHIQWDLDALDQPPAGVQIWRSTSPFELLASLEGNDAKGPFIDEGAAHKARYIVTAYYGKTAQGGFVTDILEAPGYEQEEALNSAATSLSADSRWTAPLWLILLAINAAILVAAALFLSRRRSAEKQAPQADSPPEALADNAAPPAEPSPAAAAPAEEPGPTATVEEPRSGVPDAETQAREWMPKTGPIEFQSGEAPKRWDLSCPRCRHPFAAMGIKPLHTSCPNCGVKGMLP